MLRAHCILSISALRVAFRIQNSTQSVTFSSLFLLSLSHTLSFVSILSVSLVSFNIFEHSIDGKCSKLNNDAHIVMPGVTFSTWCRSQLHKHTPKFKTHCVSVVNFLSRKRLQTYLSSISVSVSLCLSSNVVYASHELMSFLQNTADALHNTKCSPTLPIQFYKYMSICVTQSVQMSYHYNDKFITQTYKHLHGFGWQYETSFEMQILSLLSSSSSSFVHRTAWMIGSCLACIVDLNMEHWNYTRKGSDM